MRARADSLEQFIWELRRSFRELAAAADQALQPLGLEARDRAFLEFLAREKGPVSLSDVARKHAVSRQYIHQVLQRLPDRGWVEEIEDPADGRTVLLRLSRKGRAQWAKIREVDRTLLGKLAAEFTEEQLSAATALLGRLRQALGS
jgi:DNA-binding MarR family transcriptional regulator